MSLKLVTLTLTTTSAFLRQFYFTRNRLHIQPLYDALPSDWNDRNVSNMSIRPVDNQLQSDQPNQIITKGFIPTGSELMSPADTSKNRLPPAAFSPIARKYVELVENLTPNEMLMKFSETAPKYVQEAAKSTIVTIMGTLPSYALDAALITTSSKLANLIYQMQMTGYMLKNGEYRMSLTRTLKGLPKLPERSSLKAANVSVDPLMRGTKVIGEVTMKTATGENVQVDASELMFALSKEIESLRTELSLIRNERETELKMNLLTYIQALPERDMKRLTSDISDDVMDSMKMLVSALMERLGIDITGPEMVIQQSVNALSQLCMWQIVVGYKLREMEALERGVSFMDAIDD